MKNDLTILFYTANRISDKILNYVIEDLKNFDYPIISISQKPINLGKNIVVPKAYSVINLYNQVLIGAKEATTEYVALCEDDCLYIKEHFEYRPKNFGYNKNRWLLHIREKEYSYRNGPVLSQCIANREILIKTLEERLSLHNLPKELCGEPGRLEKRLGITEYDFEMFETKKSNLIVCHSWGIMGHKIPGINRTKYLEQFGNIEDWIEKLTS